MKDFLKKIVPEPIRRAKDFIMDSPRLVKNNLLDLADRLSGNWDGMTPPRNMIFIGDGDFRELGEEFLGYIISLGKLEPEGSVLDVGCGIGRVAIPLTRHLNEKGRYEGFDIVEKGINWCREKITPRYPNFHFQISDVYNEIYRPQGRFKPGEYIFPYEDETFDLVYLVSVFTHMFPGDEEHYLAEISRVLKKGGRALISYFLITKESRELMKQGRSMFRFFDTGKGYHTISESNPLVAIGLEEDYVRETYHGAGLEIEKPIFYGSWCERKKFLSLQDFILSIKK